MRPITPAEVGPEKLKNIPDYVISVFNTLIVKKWNGHKAVVLQNEVIDKIVEIGNIDRYNI